MTVYLDSVFALNFAVNWLLLRAAGGELVSSLLLQDHCFSSHCVLPPN